MKRNRPILAILIVIGVVLLARFAIRKQARFSKPLAGNESQYANPTTTVEGDVASSTSKVVGTALTKKDKDNIGKIVRAFGAPINFYGRAVDQFGEPVSGAKVFYSVADQYFGKSAKYENSSDSNGFFSITGIKGAGVYVEVSKTGYDRIPEKSYASFGYGVPSTNPRPSKNDPATFVLRKKNEAQSLMTIDQDVVIPTDGKPVAVNLRSGKTVSAQEGDLLIECWADNRNRDEKGHYDWHFRLTVPAGGLVHRDNGALVFDAPPAGYEPFKEFQMSKTDVRWKDNFDDNFFVNTRDGNYALVRFRITTGGDHFATIVSYLNPSGSRNLEYDPAKAVKPK